MRADNRFLFYLFHFRLLFTVIVEPVPGSTGVLPPPEGYLQRLREICTKHDILLIFDEVITGFGRLGAPFGANKFDVTPDIITCAKGLTNGTVPQGAVICDSKIYQAMADAAERDEPAATIELFHGYTYRSTFKTRSTNVAILLILSFMG